jgi:cytochrome c5
MVKNMGWILGAVTVLALVIIFTAQMFGPNVTDANHPIVRNALIERIAPVANVRTSAGDLPQASAVMVVASGPKSGEELVNGACAACHAAGVAGAPLLGDEAAWASRRELGLEVLVASVVNGKGSMPARGGSTYSDEEITRAVQHLAMFEPLEAPAPAATDNIESVAVEATDAVVAVVMGQVPEGLTDNIKGAVNGVCAGCHIAGVANAPKFGDREAWQPKADKGLAALVASVTNGLNVMPPRGGSNLTDEEIPIAIQYMLSK